MPQLFTPHKPLILVSPGPIKCRVLRYYLALPHLPGPSEFLPCLKILHEYLNILREIDLFLSFQLRSFVGNMVSALTVIVPEDIPMEDAKALVIYWHEKHYSATNGRQIVGTRQRSTPSLLQDHELNQSPHPRHS
jgi:hypothetical protein